MQVWEQGGDFPTLLKQDEDIKKHLTDKEIDKAFDMKNHLKNVDKIFNRVFKKKRDHEKTRTTLRR